MTKPRPAGPAAVLVGMPASGKSTVGVPLAGLLGVPFVDPDRLIESGEGKPLGAVGAGPDRAGFLAIEERYNLAVPAAPSVIAPGGSVIYSAAALARYRSFATVVWLDVPVAELTRRLGCLKDRAVVIAPGMTLHDLAEERRPLLAAAAHHRVPTAGRGPDAVAREIAGLVGSV